MPQQPQKSSLLAALIDLLLFRPRRSGTPDASPSPGEAPPGAAEPQAAISAPGRVSTTKKAIPAAILAMIAGTIALEGGYVNHPADPGGETNMGITKKVARKSGYTGPMRTLPRDVAVSIYYKDYIVKPGFEPLVEVNAPVVEEMYDTGTNMGPMWPSKFLQQSINEHCGWKLHVDGQVGPGTINAFVTCQNHLGAAKMCRVMLDSLDAKQAARYRSIVAHRPSSKVFLKGWMAHRIGNVDRRKCNVG
jgi:hypothetical protein